jgi:hypothetical protein
LPAYSDRIDELLFEVRTHSDKPQGDNKREWIYRQGWRTEANDIGERRNRFPVCILHRVRCVYPNPLGQPYIGHRRHADDAQQEADGDDADAVASQEEVEDEGELYEDDEGDEIPDEDEGEGEYSDDFDDYSDNDINDPHYRL